MCNESGYESFKKWFENENFCNQYELSAHAMECIYRAWLAGVEYSISINKRGE